MSKSVPNSFVAEPTTATRWEHFPHQADVGVRGYGPTLEMAFEQAAMALTAVVTNPELVRTEEEITVVCEAPDHELLLTDWLNAIIFESASRNMLFSRFKVRVIDSHLHARVWGEKVEVVRHKPAVEVKGATYTELCVNQTEEGWVAQCVVDV